MRSAPSSKPSNATNPERKPMSNTNKDHFTEAKEIAAMLGRANDAVSQATDAHANLRGTALAAEPWALHGALQPYMALADARKARAVQAVQTLNRLHRAAQLASMRNQLHSQLEALPAQIDAAEKEADEAIKQTSATAKKAKQAAVEALGKHKPLATRLSALNEQIAAQDAAVEAAIEKASQALAQAVDPDAIQKASQAKAEALLRRNQAQDGSAIRMERAHLATLEQEASAALAERERESADAESDVASAKARRLACDADRAALVWFRALLSAAGVSGMWTGALESAHLTLLTVPSISVSQLHGTAIQFDASGVALAVQANRAPDVDDQELAEARAWLAQDKADEAQLNEGETQRQQIWKQVQTANNPHNAGHATA